jgi:hypothetical protein
MDLFAERTDIAVAVSGSLASGKLDGYSDLDLDVLVRDDTQLPEVTDWMRKRVSGLGLLLTSFPATHLGLRDLWIFFFEHGGAVEKADVWMVTPETFGLVAGARVVYDPSSLLAGGERPAPPMTPDFEDLYHKFCGWIWFTCVKIARGEYFEAASSLETMRSHALLPGMHLVHGLPYEGYRKLEARLPAPLVAELAATYPRELTAPALVRALLALTALFERVQAEAAARLPKDHRTARLDRMRELAESFASHVTAQP